VSVSNTKLWTWHVGAGLVLLVLLGLHMFGMHLNDLLHMLEGDPISWSSMAARAKLVSQAIFYILFLGFALYHGLHGLRNILLELNPSQGMQGIINTVILVGGVVLFVFGTWAAIAAYGLANAPV